jgi:glycosyltransferase involved in cell wall biosynthesis
LHPSDQPLVSVVTPVYNGERYLTECIESVLAQTYENWEYVIVNNCSTDRSLEIATRYAEKDSRIRVHSNREFLPVIQNWNHALRQISPESKYCKEVHADDWLFPACLAEMVAVAETHSSVGMVGAYRLEGPWVESDGLPYPSTIVPGREVCRLSLLGQLHVFASPTSWLIRSDHLRSRKAFYNESYLHADAEACFAVLRHSDFGFVHQVLTFTRLHSQSISASLAQQLDTPRLDLFRILKEYGPVYLSAEDYDACVKKSINAYYRFLAHNVVRRKGRDFWEYHRTGLETLGYPFSWAKLVRVSVAWVLGHLLNPKRIVEGMKYLSRESISGLAPGRPNRKAR